jgi:hypothetical protein
VRTEADAGGVAPRRDRRGAKRYLRHPSAAAWVGGARPGCLWQPLCQAPNWALNDRVQWEGTEHLLMARRNAGVQPILSYSPTLRWQRVSLPRPPAVQPTFRRSGSQISARGIFWDGGHATSPAGQASHRFSGPLKHRGPGGRIKSSRDREELCEGQMAFRRPVQPVDCAWPDLQRHREGRFELCRLPAPAPAWKATPQLPML